jgi:uncharacterized protein YcnI
MTRSLPKRSAIAGGVVAALTLAVATPAAAHVTVAASTATQGGYATVTFKVPTESDTASTTKLEVSLPTDAPFASVSLKPVPGWTAVAEKAKLSTPIEAHGTPITAAVSKITWTATGDAAIKPGQFQTFDVSMGPLPKADRVVFKAVQTYSDAGVVRWIDEPAADGAEPDKPAPTLTLTAAGAAPAAGPTVTAASAPTEGDGGTPYGIAGMVLGLAGLVLGVLAYRRTGATAGAPAAARPEVPAGRT